MYVSPFIHTLIRLNFAALDDDETFFLFRERSCSDERSTWSQTYFSLSLSLSLFYISQYIHMKREELRILTSRLETRLPIEVVSCPTYSLLSPSLSLNDIILEHTHTHTHRIRYERKTWKTRNTSQGYSESVDHIQFDAMVGMAWYVDILLCSQTHSSSSKKDQRVTKDSWQVS